MAALCEKKNVPYAVDMEEKNAFKVVELIYPAVPRPITVDVMAPWLAPAEEI